MSSKIFASPGVSSRPLTVFERAQIWVTDARENWTWGRVYAHIWLKVRSWRRNRDLKPLLRALEAGNYSAKPTKLTQGSELKVESLEATMRLVTFDGTLKL